MPPLPTADVADVTDATVLIDVRRADEWELGHAPSARHIPMDQVPDRLAEFPTSGDVIIVCHMGGRSARVTEFLLEQGIACRNLDGGMLAWASAGRPMTSENGQPPTV